LADDGLDLSSLLGPTSIEIGTLPFAGDAAPEMDMTSAFETEVETDV
jgi:hypothetical protein